MTAGVSGLRLARVRLRGEESDPAAKALDFAFTSPPAVDSDINTVLLMERILQQEACN